MNSKESPLCPMLIFHSVCLLHVDWWRSREAAGDYRQEKKPGLEKPAEL